MKSNGGPWWRDEAYQLAVLDVNDDTVTTEILYGQCLSDGSWEYVIVRTALSGMPTVHCRMHEGQVSYG